MQSDAILNMDRRALMAQAFMLIGLTAVPSDALIAAAPKGKRVLTAPQLKLLSAVADTIIPATTSAGAVGAGVPSKIDGMLANWASASTKANVIGALTAIDKLAMASDKKGFAALTPARRKALLVGHDAAALKSGPPPKVKLTGLAAMLAGPPVMDPNYLRLKGLIISLYYNSQIAMTKELVYEHNPGAWVPSLKITPETRPFAGTGGLF
jgi:gluconate 2-dehydrogenase gamma chain